MVTGIISADQRPTLETGPSLRNRGDRAYHHKKKVQINHNRFLGYTKDANGNLIIDSTLTYFSSVAGIGMGLLNIAAGVGTVYLGMKSGS